MDSFIHSTKVWSYPLNSVVLLLSVEYTVESIKYLLLHITLLLVQFKKSNLSDIKIIKKTFC